MTEPTPVVCPALDGAPSAPPNIAAVEQIVRDAFPDLWPAVELGLAVCATLLLKDNANPTAVIYTGPPAAGKTTVTSMFDGATVKVGARVVELCYRSDGFTPASFVSQAANVSREDLERVDLLPRIKDKVLLTPELAPILRGKEDDLVQRLSILTQVLDGQGRTIDGGTHGRRGHVGEHYFAWLGCTTPLDKNVWRVMAQLGSRLFFLVMETGEAYTVERLLRAQEEAPYKTKLAECKAALHPFLSALFEAWGGIRGVAWRMKEAPLAVREWIARFALVLAAMRSARGQDATSDAPIVSEAPLRALEVLTNLAKAHALVYGRSQLSEDDLPMLVRVTLSSMPPEGAAIFRALAEQGGAPLTVEQARLAMRVKSRDTAAAALDHLDRLGVVAVEAPGKGKESHATFREAWAWCASPRFAGLMAEALPLKKQGVCPSLPISDLANRQGEEVREKHTRRKIGGCRAPDAALDPTPLADTRAAPSDEACE